jgi:hypothetical protein
LKVAGGGIFLKFSKRGAHFLQAFTRGENLSAAFGWLSSPSLSKVSVPHSLSDTGESETPQ